MQPVIPGLTKPAPYLILGNPGFFWIPAFAGMTRYALIIDDMYKIPLGPPLGKGEDTDSLPFEKGEDSGSPPFVKGEDSGSPPFVKGGRGDLLLVAHELAPLRG